MDKDRTLWVELIPTRLADSPQVKTDLAKIATMSMCFRGVFHRQS
jgi:hypothetical protein